MVVLIYQNHLHIYSSPSPPSLLKTKSSLGSSLYCSMASTSDWKSNLLEFPHLSTTHRNLMLDLFSSVDAHLGPHLLPSATPPDVAFFEDEQRTSQGSLDIRLGQNDSAIDFILGSWLHCKLPSASASINITTLSAFLKSTTDAPHLLLEFIQSSPNSLILLMDLLPRKDLVLHPDYLHTFYQDTQLEKQRQTLDKLQEAQPYFSSSLYIRSILSPTAMVVNIKCDNMEEIVRDHVGVVAKELLRIWLESCGGKREIGEFEREILVRRDDLVKRKTLEIDLASNMPRLFGTEIAGRLVSEIQKAFSA
ncbi:red chlorophyll catabolite reductase-like [Tasmannia lanceolata]|uniref:red chlorophyll catabolite reductase-like n=1 Tax=Tasmannia lanceolata TaxID=3420 RepID=UPI004063374F